MDSGFWEGPVRLLPGNALALAELRFRVESEGRIDINAVVIRSRYSGPFGVFDGVLRPEGVEEVRVDGLFGMGEDFYLRC